MPSQTSKPKNYFLNESHELSVQTKKFRGTQLPILNVDWAQRGQKLHRSLEQISSRANHSRDPLARKRYYLLTDRMKEIVVSSDAKDAVQGQKRLEVVFSGEQSKWFGRVGLELIEVHPNGAATVHATPEHLEQLISKTGQLAQLGTRDQARFAAFESFEWLPGKLKYDQDWLAEIGQQTVEGYIKLQPLISEIEADLVIHALNDIFRAHPGQSLAGKGRTYLGRFYLRAKLNAQLVKKLADEFTSIQSLHPPIYAFTESIPPEIITNASATSLPPAQSPQILPCVGVVDTAVPQEHNWLKPYRRGIVLGLNCSNTENDHHGSMVASRIVFGEADLGRSQTPPPATCRFFEVRVGSGKKEGNILGESVSDALKQAIISAPELRVFNLSFDGDRRLDDLPPTKRKETLKQIEELDNFAFDQDVLLVVAAGNSTRTAIPTSSYPNHFNDPGWELHTYPRAFNALTCGGVAHILSAGGLAPEVDAPSPFTRVGPGFASSPKPDLCDSAGNTDVNYRPLAGAGVWGFSTLGYPLESVGTSYAAPLLAREAAFVFEELRPKCPGDSRPFACTVKAVLALTADDIAKRLDESLQPLANRTIGFGRAKAEYFRKPVEQRARFVWQGVIANQKDIARVQLPIPKAWVEKAVDPRLQLCVAWDTPVSAAAASQWSCRDVNVTIHPGPDAKGLHGSRGKVAGYPLFRRTWKLEKAKQKKVIEGDFWVLEFSYTEIAAYAADHNVPQSQRVALAAEIWDAGETPVEPHSFVQSLPIASSLVRLSNTSAWLPQAISITSDI